MKPELIEAIKERLRAGQSDEDISQQLRSSGYADDVIEHVLHASKENGLSATDLSPIPVSVTPDLPGATDLFQGGWAYVQKRMDLIGYLFIPYAVLALAPLLLGSTVSSSIAAGIMTGVVTLAAGVFIFLNLGALLYSVVMADEKEVRYPEALRWMMRNVGRVAWLYILMALVTYGGFLFFIIPGIIVSIAVYFSHFVYVAEGKRGMEALLRSRSLVTGNWGRVFGRLFLLGLILILIFVLLAGLVTLAVSSIASQVVAEIVSSLVFQGAAVFISVITFHAGQRLYRKLAAARPATAGRTDKWKYKTLAGLGVLLPIVLIVIVVAFASFAVKHGIGLDGMTVDPSPIDRGAAKERAIELRMNNEYEQTIEDQPALE